MAIGNYAFKKPWLRAAATVVDGIGYKFRKPAERLTASPKRALVVRLDQLGDIVQALPVLESLRASHPAIEIDFLTTPVGAELVRIFDPKISTIVWNCPWFDRSRRPNIAVSELRRTLAARTYDVVLELRGDVRLIRFLKSIGAKTVVGYGATGGGFLLDVEARWEASLPAIDKNLRLVEAIGTPVVSRVPTLPLKMSAGPSARPFFVVHPDAGTEAKRWPLDSFVQTIDALTEAGNNVVLVGLNQRIGEAVTTRVKRPVENQMGKTSLPMLLSILAQSEGLLTNDSGPGHLAAALGKPVWVLWSGTAVSSVWAPRGQQIHLFEFPVACAPCALPRCPVPGHPCLTKIRASDVVRNMNYAHRT